ncbi:posphoenolpyruvate synthetase regulatory kinase/phosphorylase PpsR [Bordetella pertussis]|uniref:posphoenolpyruvate synthetase regulatory kinase/phosphorylase PpsR n=1 Tax=Bordetella pertussis TaxID=520 RepID=UPI0005DFEF78|nr:pyruvate, water dikinase regulatory protein [Bordetella pertussis]CFV87037.1 Putative phosphotransferase ydiA [Bordetella pertussis]CFW37984.1 Putative phosphotransferase ydiA [Bordetella pertussis]CRE23017.1 Putative phosphotransferase ydiA [Bordetella pertussis]
MTSTPIERAVYIVSDSTGITAETFSHSVLSQFDEVNFKPVRLPFIDTLDKAREVVARINRNALEAGVPPIVFSTLVNPEILALVRQSNGVFLDLFGTFVSHIEQALGLKSSHSIGRSHMAANSEKYRNRIDAINFSLAHDDGQFVNQLDQADVILLGVSRCGKPPTSLYLAMQYAVKAANFPLTPDDFERGALPKTIAPYRGKLFGLSIQPERLAEVRNERRPNSHYARLEQCRYEVAEAERMMRREGISWLSTTTKSIEEIATTVLQEVGLERV